MEGATGLPPASCDCASCRGVHTIIYAPGSCEAVVQCEACGALWYALLREQMRFDGADDLEEYQIPISPAELAMIQASSYADLSLRFLLGRSGRVLYPGGAAAVSAEFALGRCGRLPRAD